MRFPQAFPPPAERYKAYLAGDFKSQVKGFFTDEPAMHYFETGRDNFIVPWTHGMFKIFRERNGYDLKKNLPKLFFDCGGDTEQVRYDFWSTLTDRYEHSYFKPIEDWCAENDVISTGHLLYEESLRMHARVDGNLFKHLQHFHMTGVDHLYPRVGTREMENEHVALKIASSAAHQNGSARLVCESMGGSYWDCTMERMKWIGDWEYVLGVNQFIPHGFHYTIEGERKRDWPPSMFCQFTWWEQYKQFNDYMTRLGYTLSGGDHVAKVAVLYPMNSIWANYMPNRRTKISECIEREFNYLADRMLRLHIDYDYIDEDVLNERTEIRDGKLCIQGERYEMLLLPPCTHIKAKTLDTMEAFVKAGGKLGADALLPYRCIEGKAERFAERIEALFGVDPTQLRERFLAAETRAQTLTGREIAGGKVLFVSGEGFKRNPDEGEGLRLLDTMLRACVTPELEIDSEEVFSLHRVKDGKDLFFLINPVDFAADVTIRFLGAHTPELWDLETGAIRTAPVYAIENGYTSLSAHFEPFGSAMFSFADETEPAHLCASDLTIESFDPNTRTAQGFARLTESGSVTLAENGKTLTRTVEAAPPMEPIVLTGPFRFATDKPNSLNTDAWRMTYAKEDDDVEAITSGKADMTNWLPMRMGAWEMQLPVERDEETYPVTLWYVTKIAAAFVPDDLKLMIDGFKGKCHTLFVNGKEVTETPERSYLDAEIKTVPMQNFFTVGENTVAVRLTVTKKSDGMTDLLKIIGSFSVDEIDGVETIVPPKKELPLGDWNRFGYPYYSGTGLYTATVELTQEQLSKKLLLQAEIGRDVLTVAVNGTPVKTCLWRPYEADLTPYLQVGENEITLGVVNTLMNLLESTHNPSGLFAAEIVPFDRYTVQF